MFQKIHKSNEINALFLAGILNPWTGEPIHLSEDQDENSAPDGKSQFLIISLFGAFVYREKLCLIFCE